MLSPMKKKKYYPNNWKAIKDAPDEAFALDEGQPLSFEEFMLWKFGNWELDDDVNCIIRVHTKRKVKEYVYSNKKWANKKIRELLVKGHEFTIAADDRLEHVPSQFLE